MTLYHSECLPSIQNLSSAIKSTMLKFGYSSLQPEQVVIVKQFILGFNTFVYLRTSNHSYRLITFGTIPL